MSIASCLLFLAPAQVLLAPQYPQYQQYPTYQQRFYQNYQNGPQQTYSYPSYSQQPYTSQSVSYPSYPSNRQYTYSSYPVNYQQQQQPTRYSYPAYQPQQTYQQQQQQQRSGESSRAYQDPVFNYMITDLSYFGPEPEVSRPSRASPPSSYYSTESEKPAWQGKVAGQARTRCHDGVLLPFRARCNKVKECSKGEDEFDCDWHKRSTVDTITTRQQFEKLVRENENVMVEFFAPWCPACVTFLPHLETLKDSNADLPLTVVKVNTDEDPELKELFSVDTFPRIMLWSKRWGEGDIEASHRTYNKSLGMNSTNIQKWLNNQLL